MLLATVTAHDFVTDLAAASRESLKTSVPEAEDWSEKKHDYMPEILCHETSDTKSNGFLAVFWLAV